MTDYLSWNGLPKVKARQYENLLDYQLPDKAPKPFLVYGNGRSYSDVCLNGLGTLFLTKALNNFCAFDSKAGILRAQGGVLLSEILELIVPQGWFLPETPGTSFVTLAGAVANDVHGKGHHKVGSFGNNVRSLLLVRSNGERLNCSPTENEALFRATIGGLGLTGFIAEVEIQLQKISNPYVICENHEFASLDEYWQLNEKLKPEWPYSVSWIDCISKNTRGVFMVGRHAPANTEGKPYKPLPLTVPFQMPISLVNGLSIRLVNAFYYRMNRGKGAFVSHYKPFFYPLDSITEWNRIYGAKGFYQYQCVIPPSEEREGIKAVFAEIRRAGQGSFLGVLKTFGDIPSLGLLSFPRPGTTLALDFPNRNKKTMDLFNRLDHIVREAGGALYPAKDARMPREMFQFSYPKLNEFFKYVDEGFSSHFIERMKK